MIYCLFCQTGIICNTHCGFDQKQIPHNYIKQWIAAQIFKEYLQQKVSSYHGASARKHRPRHENFAVNQLRGTLSQDCNKNRVIQFLILHIWLGLSYIEYANFMLHIHYFFLENQYIAFIIILLVFIIIGE